jgi:Ni/Fe-hydrogenase subunit HybB-like protein
MKTVYRFGFWRMVFFLLMAGACVATYQRFMNGIGAATNLSDQFPWGIWIGFDILCGVGLAAGGFTLVATVHIFNAKRFEPIVRPAILTAFLGYILVIGALMFDLGQPWRIWHPLIMWNPHSVMFEVGWCVMLYTTVLSLEFLPAVLEKFGMHKALGWLKLITVPLMIAGVILSTLHQSSLGSLYLLVPHKLHPLWYSPVLPVMFYLSAISVGIAMTLFENWHSCREFGHRLSMPITERLARVLAVLLAVNLMIRFVDLRHRDALQYAFRPGTEMALFWVEIALPVIAMALLFSSRIRASADGTYAAALLAIFGFITHRLNVSVTGMEASSGTHYFPKWTEITVTLALIAVGFAMFRFVARHFPVFEGEEVAVQEAEVRHEVPVEHEVPVLHA